MHALNTVELPIFVDVVLVRPSRRPRAPSLIDAAHPQVGFAGDGAGGLRLEADELRRHLDVLRRDHHWAHLLVAGPNRNHTLPFKVEYIFKAHSAPPYVMGTQTLAGSPRRLHRAPGP